MGQMAIGIIYGCEVPAGLGAPGEIDFIYTLVETFNKANGLGWTGRHLDTFPDGDLYMAGVLVAIGGSGKDGVKSLWEEWRVSEIATSEDAAAARALWERFAAWCRAEHGVEWPTAELWIIPTETA
jgi:hypothetical protein